LLNVETITDHKRWNDTLRSLPRPHVLQTWEWGEFKRRTTGWEPRRLAFKQEDTTVAMASVGVRKVGPARVMYAPKGPVLSSDDPAVSMTVIEQLQQLARREGAIWLKIDPDVVAATGIPGEDDDTSDANGQAVIAALSEGGWRFSDEQPQFRNTITIDLTQPEDDILMAMSGNTRRKVRTATKKDVVIRAGTIDDLQTLYDLYTTTGERNDFITRPLDYYRQAWSAFIEAGLAQPLIAEFEGQAIAHVILFHFGSTCWYMYGASANHERNRMPTYALQWEAMKWAKAQGYTTYDMWGAPNNFDESDSMWGVYEFKRGFRGTVTRHIGAWDYAPYPPLYWGYTQIMPRIINRMRSRAQS
jgi:peptidoglycan pentaglycine glycine transferase (the first glycine)